MVVCWFDPLGLVAAYEHPIHQATSAPASQPLFTSTLPLTYIHMLTRLLIGQSTRELHQMAVVVGSRPGRLPRRRPAGSQSGWQLWAVPIFRFGGTGRASAHGARARAIPEDKENWPAQAPIQVSGMVLPQRREDKRDIIGTSRVSSAEPVVGSLGL